MREREWEQEKEWDKEWKRGEKRGKRREGERKVGIKKRIKPMLFPPLNGLRWPQFLLKPPLILIPEARYKSGENATGYWAELNEWDAVNILPADCCCLPNNFSSVLCSHTSARGLTDAQLRYVKQCNTLYIGLPLKRICKLQLVQDGLVHMVFRQPRFAHMSSLYIDSDLLLGPIQGPGCHL